MKKLKIFQYQNHDNHRHNLVLKSGQGKTKIHISSSVLIKEKGPEIIMQCSSKLISRGSKSQHNQPNLEQSVEESRKHEAKGPIKDRWLKPSQGRQKGKAKERPKDAQPAATQKKRKKEKRERERERERES